MNTSHNGPSDKPLREGLRHLSDRATAGDRFVYQLTPEQAAAVLADRQVLLQALRTIADHSNDSMALKVAGDALAAAGDRR